jgi:hypothetical protein
VQTRSEVVEFDIEGKNINIRSDYLTFHVETKSTNWALPLIDFWGQTLMK